MIAIWIVAALAAVVGSAVGSAAGGVTRPWFLAVVGAITAIEVSLGRRAHAGLGDGVGYRRWRRLEFVGGVAGVRLLQAITGGAGGLAAATVADRETVTGIVILVMVRSAANATIDDLNAVEGGVERTDGTDPMGRLRGRTIGYAMLTTVAVGYAAVGNRGLFDLGRSGAERMGWEPLWYLAVALPALAGASLRAHQARWRRDGATVDEVIPERWLARGLAISIAVVLAVVTAWSVSLGGSSLVAIGVTKAGPVGEWIVERLDGLGDTERDAAERGPGAGSEPASELELEGDRVPPWLGEVMFWGIAVGIIAWAGLKGRQAGLRDPSRAASREGIELRAWLRELKALLAALWRGLIGLVRRVRLAVNNGDRSSPVSRMTGEAHWQPDDRIRSRIAVAYRRAARQITPAGEWRRSSETLREYATRAGRLRPHLARDFGEVTDVYEEARFSRHHLTDDHAVRAERAAQRVEGVGPSRDG